MERSKSIQWKSMEEDAPANAVGGGNIAGLGVDHPDYPESGEPTEKKKKKRDTLIDGRTKHIVNTERD